MFTPRSMGGEKNLSGRDYVIWFLIVGLVFLVWMWAGDWGAPPVNPGVSPISQHVFAPYTVVYVGAGVVTALFMGSMIFFVYRFREREEYGEG
jgi:heme/copper-type cytochrome/quinol oxidase subunit 2